MRAIISMLFACLYFDIMFCRGYAFATTLRADTLCRCRASILRRYADFQYDTHYHLRFILLIFLS